MAFVDIQGQYLLLYTGIQERIVLFSSPLRPLLLNLLDLKAWISEMILENK